MCETLKYKIKIGEELRGRQIDLTRSPELNIIYLQSENNLCPSNYSSAVCFWEGDLSVVLSINGEKITLNDHDQKRGTKSIVKFGKYRYEFQGVAPHVENRSRNETYLIFSVTKCL